MAHEIIFREELFNIFSSSCVWLRLGGVKPWTTLDVGVDGYIPEDIFRYLFIRWGSSVPRELRRSKALSTAESQDCTTYRYEHPRSCNLTFGSWEVPWCLVELGLPSHKPGSTTSQVS